MINEKESQEEEGVWVDEVMFLSCLFLIGLSRNGDNNNSFVAGWRRRCCE